MNRIYLSGPMTGKPDWNFPAFNAEAARLRALGYEVVNPVDINPDTTTPYQECLRQDLKALLDCDALALLDGWQGSVGAHLEMHVAHRVGMGIAIAREITIHAAGRLLNNPTTDEVLGTDIRECLRNLIATIELHTDCMDGRIDRSALDSHIERAEDLLGEALEEIVK